MSRHLGTGALALVFAATACDSPKPPTIPTPDVSAMRSPTPAPPAPSPASDPIVGRYTAEVAAGADCATVPEEARRRSYEASITAAGSDKYVVTLGGAAFLQGDICTMAPSGLGCHQFVASRAGDRLRFELLNENDDGHGGHIVEQLPPGTWIELIGSGTGRMQDGRITATGDATIWYCSTASAYPFPCASYTSCRSDDLRLTFARQ
jgi:hypothetical protein